MSFTNQTLTGVTARNPIIRGLAELRSICSISSTWMNRGEFGSSLLLTAQFVIGSALIGQAGLGLLIALAVPQRMKGICCEQIVYHAGDCGLDYA